MKTALGVEEHHSLAVWVGGDMGHCQASHIENVVWDTTSSHYIIDKKGNDRTTSAGKSLMQGNILYNARNTDGICPQWTKIAREQGGKTHLPLSREYILVYCKHSDR